MPKYLIWECIFNLYLFVLISGSRSKCFQGDLNLMTSVLFYLKIICYFHWTKSFNSWLMTDSVVPRFLGGNKRWVSSAKWWTTDFEKTFCRSFIYRRKSKRPNVEPCGAPQVTVLILEEYQGKLTYCFLRSRNDFSQLLASPWIS